MKPLLDNVKHAFFCMTSSKMVLSNRTPGKMKKGGSALPSAQTQHEMVMWNVSPTSIDQTFLEPVIAMTFFDLCFWEKHISSMLKMRHASPF